MKNEKKLSLDIPSFLLQNNIWVRVWVRMVIYSDLDTFWQCIFVHKIYAGGKSNNHILLYNKTRLVSFFVYERISGHRFRWELKHCSLTLFLLQYIDRVKWTSDVTVWYKNPAMTVFLSTLDMQAKLREQFRF